MCFDLHSNTSNTRLATFCYATKSRGPFAAQPCGITETSQCAMGCHSLGNEQNPPVMFFSKTIQGLVFTVHKGYMHKMRAWFFLYGLYFVSDMVLWTWDWDHEIRVFLFQAHTAKPAKKWIKSLSPWVEGFVVAGRGSLSLSINIHCLYVSSFSGKHKSFRGESRRFEKHNKIRYEVRWLRTTKANKGEWIG